MIERERLKELIEQSATIYAVIKEPFIAGYSSFLKITPIQLNNCYGISGETYNKINKCIPKFYYMNGVTRSICDADEIFETKEEAEWYLEFGNIKRTETLTLPTWEEAQKGISYQFYAPRGNVYLLETKVKTGYSCDRENPYIIRIERIGYSNEENDYEFNKENYTEACRLAKKLFLGEEV